MQEFRHEFIEFILKHQALRFGSFTLKSGRKSPYFFNSGLFNDGTSFIRLCRFYATTIKNAGLDFDVIYGPAYKGIPLAVGVAMVFAEDYKQNYPVCFNRKERKSHGEGGKIIGAKPAGRVLIIDDVISAGTSLAESITLIKDHGAEPVGAAIAFDREERAYQANGIALEEFSVKYDMKIISILKLQHIVTYLERQDDMQKQLTDIKAYQHQYGIERQAISSETAPIKDQFIVATS